MFVAGALSALLYLTIVYQGPVRGSIGSISFSSSHLFRPALGMLASFAVLLALGVRIPARNDVFVVLVSLAAYSFPPFSTPSGDVLATGYTALSIATGRGASLEGYPELVEDGIPYYVAETEEGLRSRYPLGPALLAWPFFLPAPWSDLPRPELVARASRFAAIGLALASVLLALKVARRLEPPLSPEALTLVLALGTTHGSVAAETLWQHGPGALWLLGALERLLAIDAPLRRRMLALGACLGFAGWTRPILFLPAALIAAAACLRLRRGAAPAFWSGAAVTAVGLLYNLGLYGAIFGGYSGHFERMTETTLAGAVERSFWLVFSPSRGMLWFEPVVLFGIALGAARLLGSGRKRALALGLAGFLAVFFAYSRFDVWWAGHSFGPRFMTDSLAMWFLAAASMGPVPRWCRFTMVLLAAGGASLAAAHFGGARIYWNERPSVDWFPDRAQALLDSQLLTSVLSIEPGGELGLAQRASDEGDRRRELLHLENELAERPWNRFAAVRLTETLVRLGRFDEAQRMAVKFGERWEDDSFLRHLARRLPRMARLMEDPQWMPALGARASRNRDLAEHVLDENLETRWTTRHPQRANDWLELELDPDLPTRGIALLAAPEFGHGPTGLELYGCDAAGDWVHLGTHARVEAPLKGWVAVRFSPVRLRKLRVVLLRDDPAPWSVSEARLLSAYRSGSRSGGTFSASSDAFSSPSEPR